MDYKLIYLARRNPAVSPEDWPRAWRSHAKFASQFPVIGAKISSLLYCARVYAPELDGARFDPPGASTAYDGAALVASPTAAALDGDMTAEDRARVLADELRVFDAPTPTFSFHCREVLVHGAAPGAAAVIRFLARRDGLSPEAFQHHWRGHAEAAVAAGTVVRYVQNALTAPPPPGYPFDGVEETWFADVEQATRSFQDPAMQVVDEDLAGFCEPAMTVTLLTSVVHRWPKA